MRAALVLSALLAAPASVPAAAETSTIAAPAAALPRYDPTLSAREAVLANWDLAAGGIRAGAVLGARVVEMADRGAPWPALQRLAEQAQTTMVQRWNAAQWVYAGAPGLARVEGDALAAAARSATAECGHADCTAQIAALRDAFQTATDQMAAAAAETRDAITDRMTRPDTELMVEQLTAVADYLRSGAWSQALALAPLERGREEVAARLVGAISIWRNVEPYVGLASPQVDADINEAARELLMTLRLTPPEPGPLGEDGAEVTALKARADALAAEFRRAADLFAS